MGGYGAYVWGSFALTFIVMLTCVVQARTRQSRTYKRIQSRLKAMESVE
ncbi:MAG: heme exporter protein CcmD [Pseudomonadota bacterium]